MPNERAFESAHRRFCICEAWQKTCLLWDPSDRARPRPRAADYVAETQGSIKNE